MKNRALILFTLLLFLFTCLLIGEQNANRFREPSDEAVKLRDRVSGLEERVKLLESRLDKMTRPRVVPISK